MKNKVIAVLSALIILLGGGAAYQFGSSDARSNRIDIYGTSSGTTLASTTSKIVAIGTEFTKVNLNIKATSTAAQTIAIVPEFSNDVDCDTATYFRETQNAGNVIWAIASTPAGLTQVTTTYSLAIPSGASYNNIQLTNLNTHCIKLTLTTSSTTDPAIAWVEGLFSN